MCTWSSRSWQAQSTLCLSSCSSTCACVGLCFPPSDHHLTHGAAACCLVLSRWPELNELLQTNALSMDDVQELWVQATFLGPDGVRRMDAKGFDAFVSLCDERQLVNQGGV